MNSELTLDSVIKAYPLPETVFSQDLWKLALSARHQQTQLEREGNADEGMAINNALYLLLSKYIPKAEISSDPTVYLKNLLSAIKQARYEFSEVCYASDYASDVFQAFYAFVLSELAQVENSIQAPGKTLEPSPPSKATSTDDGQDNKHSPENRSGWLSNCLERRSYHHSCHTYFTCCQPGIFLSKYRILFATLLPPILLPTVFTCFLWPMTLTIKRG